MTAVHQVTQTRQQTIRLLRESLEERDEAIRRLTDENARLEAENVRLRRNLDCADDGMEWWGGVR